MTEKIPGQVFREALHERWSARGQCIDTRAWDELPQADQDDLEAAAQAVLDNRTPWGDVNVVSIETYPCFAVVRSGAEAEDDDVVKVIVWGDTGLTYYDSLAEWQHVIDLQAHAAGTPRDHDDPAERDDVLRQRREMAREAGDDSPGGEL